MKASKFLLATLRDFPKDAETISYRLMTRAGMVRKLSVGVYSWLPLGIRTLRKVENIIREEMNNIGAMEILMPVIQPKDLWEQTGRWESAELFKMKDRHERDFCLGPTHEEVITYLFKGDVHSHRQLPLILYQIQTKFRDEIRSRFGVMRSREFLMKDAYSFHLTEESLNDTYELMHEVYRKIFSRLGLNVRSVIADVGNMGGSLSREFQALAASGEDTVVYGDSSDYAANLEMAESLAPEVDNQIAMLDMMKISPFSGEIRDILSQEYAEILKIVVVRGKNSPYVVLGLCSGHELNEVKVSKLPEVALPLAIVGDDELFHHRKFFADPTELAYPLIIDRDISTIRNFTWKISDTENYFVNVNWQRDIQASRVADIRKVVDGDFSPDGRGKLKLAKGIEVGQIFKLGRKYTQSLGIAIPDEQGKNIEPLMGCYGIGISRLVAAVIEQNHDERGIIWSNVLAPFQIAIIPINAHRFLATMEVAERLYLSLIEVGFEVLFDDRKESVGVLFADMDLIGIPHRIVVSERGLAKDTVEYKSRTQEVSEEISLNRIIDFMINKLCDPYV